MAHGDKVSVEFGPESMRVMKALVRAVENAAPREMVINYADNKPIDHVGTQPGHTGTDDKETLSQEVIKLEQARIARRLSEVTVLSPNEIRDILNG